MIQELPNINPTARLSISAGARALGINRKTLNVYADKGKIQKFYRRLNNMPYVLGKDLLKLWQATY